MWDWLINFAEQLGYVGVFLTSLVGAMSIVIPVPYTLVILTLGTRMNPLLLAVAGGTGSAVGEFSGYLLGYYGRAIISEERQRKMNHMLRVFEHYGAIAIFLFALTPLPDDLLFIPLGIMRYNFVKAFVPSVLGKILMSSILAYGGRFYFDLLSIAFGKGESGLTGMIFTSVVTAALLIIILVALFKIDWERLFPNYTQEAEKLEDNS
ncbi:hypothetical protein GWN63_01130 [Candidatus Bathyarchaeota archaeon]|nr:hypothetical protein [Candidatus Bathyarchaeota archaeon]NIV67473.1 hypothetical protein [Candidatus Bathyarchaeota archaeon]NIW16129.1 hypothetical protein [Candidatus Bathyarchaeota archaeon]NIW34119.1 hypothetical protein [Candidatus Bathyarchaeota archaeon]